VNDETKLSLIMTTLIAGFYKLINVGRHLVLGATQFLARHPLGKMKIPALLTVGLS